MREGSGAVGYHSVPSIAVHEKMKMLVVQSCLTLCHTMDCSLPGSSVHRIFQARILEWVAAATAAKSFQSCPTLPNQHKRTLRLREGR